MQGILESSQAMRELWQGLAYDKQLYPRTRMRTNTPERACEHFDMPNAIAGFVSKDKAWMQWVLGPDAGRACVIAVSLTHIARRLRECSRNPVVPCWCALMFSN